MKKLEISIPIEQSNSLPVPLIQDACELTTNQIKQAVDKGALWLTRGKYTQRLRRVKKLLQIGDIIHFNYDEQVLSQQVPDAKLLLDKKDYSIWYKPYGMWSQGSKWGDHCTIARVAEKTLQRNSFIIHRLDRAASGIIVVGHTKKATQAFGKLFEQHSLKKVYHIIVHGKYLGIKQDVKLDIDDKSAHSVFSHLAYDPVTDQTLVEVEIKTGRKHQIRKHAALLGFPVFGDRLHGDTNKRYLESENLALCAVELSFTCPISGEFIDVLLPASLSPTLA